MDTVFIKNWELSPCSEMRTYFLAVAAILKLMNLQRDGVAIPYTFDRSNITIEAPHLQKELLITLSVYVDPLIQGSRDILDVGFAIYDKAIAKNWDHTFEGTHYDFLLWRGFLLSYREKIKRHAMILYPNWHPLLGFLVGVRDAFGHNGMIEKFRNDAEWRGLRLRDLPRNSCLYPTILGPGDLIMLLRDVDDLLKP